MCSLKHRVTSYYICIQLDKCPQTVKLFYVNREHMVQVCAWL